MFCKIIVWNRKIFIRVFQHWRKLESDRYAESTENIYLISVITIVLDSLDINKWVLLIVFLMSVGVTADRFLEYRYKYHLVGMVEEERQAIYEYYRDHPEVEEAWIKRFPIFTIHSADVEPGDTYHFETFKEYYNLPQAADKIFFYFEETE